MVLNEGFGIRPGRKIRIKGWRKPAVYLGIQHDESTGESSIICSQGDSIFHIQTNRYMGPLRNVI